jgi:hypothetical protein
MENSERYLREQLVRQIRGGNAFINIESILEEVDFHQLGKIFADLPYTFWQQLEHLRITQWDILEFCTNPQYKALDWPKDYWVPQPGPFSREEFESKKRMFFEDRDTFLNLLLDLNNDLYKPISHGDGQTLFREALLILEHNAYHTGQLMILSRLMNKTQENP